MNQGLNPKPKIMARKEYSTRRERYTIAILVAVFTYLFTSLVVNPSEFINRFSWINVVFYCIMAIITVEGNHYIILRLDRTIPWYSQPKKRLIVQLIWTIICVLITLGLPTFLYIYIKNDLEYDFVQFLILAVTFGAILLLAFSIGFSFFFNWQNSLLEQERLKQEKLKADYQVLQNQINPHFLFNNLNVLIAEIRQDKDNAIRFVEHFSEVYRYVLQSKNKELVDLETEMEFAESYCYLHTIRYGDSLRFQWHVDKKYLNRMLPPLTLQVLIENAVKHNIISSSKPLNIEIFTDGENRLVVKNNLQRKSSVQKSTGLGLSNILHRYEILTTQKVLIDEGDNYFTVSVPLLEGT